MLRLFYGASLTISLCRHTVFMVLAWCDIRQLENRRVKWPLSGSVQLTCSSQASDLFSSLRLKTPEWPLQLPTHGRPSQTRLLDKRKWKIIKVPLLCIYFVWHPYTRQTNNTISLFGTVPYTGNVYTMGSNTLILHTNNSKKVKVFRMDPKDTLQISKIPRTMCSKEVKDLIEEKLQVPACYNGILCMWYETLCSRPSWHSSTITNKI